MSFDTPAPDMTNRRNCSPPADKDSAEILVFEKLRGRGGRPPRGKDEVERRKIRATAWFYAVAMSLDEVKAGPTAIGQKMQRLAEADGDYRSNHAESGRWKGYKKGKPPGDLTVEFVESVAPGTAEIFLDGPAGLWNALWGNVDAIDLPEESAESLFDVRPAAFNLAWLTALVIAWRKRADVSKFGWAGKATDGFYEAVASALSQPAIKTQLEALHVWSHVRAEVRAQEQAQLLHDLGKMQEIFAVGAYFTKKPIQDYLDDPQDFFAKSLSYQSDSSLKLQLVF
ncbi:MAG TPA: hypothetical protein DCW29_16550 [Janthinobacterium sp.]|nr:hypothetical protein [Janthinobacterium sp.]